MKKNSLCLGLLSFMLCTSHISEVSALSCPVPGTGFVEKMKTISTAVGTAWVLAEVAYRRWNKLNKPVSEIKEDPRAFVGSIVLDVATDVGLVTRAELAAAIEEAITKRSIKMDQEMMENVIRMATDFMDRTNECGCTQPSESMTKEEVCQCVEEAMTRSQICLTPEQVREIAHDVAVDVIKQVAQKHAECGFNAAA